MVRVIHLCWKLWPSRIKLTVGTSLFLMATERASWVKLALSTSVSSFQVGTTLRKMFGVLSFLHTAITISAFSLLKGFLE